MPHSNLSYEFGPYRLNPGERVLSRNGETISLAPKAADILTMLVVRAGELVPKDELLKQVWPNTFVEEANLTQNIFLLRKVLGQKHTGPKYIETVTRRGYRFVADVKVVGGSEQRAPESKAVSEAAVPPEGLHRPVVAVLPFINTSRDEGLEYLADGLTDNIINNLSRVANLRVMSRSAVFRYKTKETDAQQVGRELGANVVLVGKVGSRGRGVVIGVELVDATAGWQLWGESFDSASQDLLEIQAAITRQLLATLKLKLTGEEEKRVTARYTENATAYQSYLEGRYHWSRYTKKGIEKAIRHFRRAIELDPNYALAYAGIVDCYLRLATNYLPPEDDLPRPVSELAYGPEMGSHDESDRRIKLRFEWDWKGAERELRRAHELKTDYPSAHQWYVAYQTSKQLFQESFSGKPAANWSIAKDVSDPKLTAQIPYVRLTPTEEVQILCSVARDQIAIGNFEAANLILRRWSTPGKWPKLDYLNPYAAADLLYTLGTLLGCVAGTKKIAHGHKHGEAFLNGAIALFQQLGIGSRSGEARIELARCYYRQGLYDIALETITAAHAELPDDLTEQKSFCLAIWGGIERETGRLKDSLTTLRAAASLEVPGRLVPGRCYHDLATTLKELGASEQEPKYSDEAKVCFMRALYETEAIGHHRAAAALENNLGLLFLSLGSFAESEQHVLRSRRLFESLSDTIRWAQCNETLAKLYIEMKRFSLAEEAIRQAIEVFEVIDGEAVLSEALTTQGLLLCKLDRFGAAKKSFEAGYRVAERCGDKESAGRALLILIEEMGDQIEQTEKIYLSEKLRKLFASTQQTALLARVEKCIANVPQET